MRWQNVLENLRGWWAIWAYVLVSLLTLVTYAWDKSRARGGGRRVPESMLHILELLGGWPGAIVGSQLFRHKRVKGRYTIVLWLIVAAHVAFWVWWIS